MLTVGEMMGAGYGDWGVRRRAGCSDGGGEEGSRFG
jgi:hypothetical protein